MARELLDRGWTDVRALKGGYDAWLLAGRPIEPRAGMQPDAPNPQDRRPTVFNA